MGRIASHGLDESDQPSPQDLMDFYIRRDWRETNQHDDISCTYEHTLAQLLMHPAAALQPSPMWEGALLLQWAIKEGHMGLVQLMLERVDKESQSKPPLGAVWCLAPCSTLGTPLGLAVHLQKRDVVELILACLATTWQNCVPERSPHKQVRNVLDALRAEDVMATMRAYPALMSAFMERVGLVQSHTAVQGDLRVKSMNRRPFMIDLAAERSPGDFWKKKQEGISYQQGLNRITHELLVARPVIADLCEHGLMHVGADDQVKSCTQCQRQLPKDYYQCNKCEVALCPRCVARQLSRYFEARCAEGPRDGWTGAMSRWKGLAGDVWRLVVQEGAAVVPAGDDKLKLTSINTGTAAAVHCGNKDTPVLCCMLPLNGAASVAMLRCCVEASDQLNSSSMFKSQAMDAMLELHWQLHAKSAHRKRLLIFALLLATFVWSSVWFTSWSISEETSLVAAAWGLQILELMLICVCLVGELKQLRFFGRSAYLRDAWNMLDLLTYALMVTGVVLHSLSGLAGMLQLEKPARAVQSMAALFMWSKVLHFFRPFRNTGPMAYMILEIFKDMRFFLGLLLIVVMGFANAFYIILSGHSSSDCSGISNANDYELCVIVAEDDTPGSYSSPARSLRSAFAYMLGDFPMNRNWMLVQLLKCSLFCGCSLRSWSA
ncbi:unnamed protein product [Chrysoparadoxa australica]